VLDDKLIFYNWMPCIADWSMDCSDEFYRSNSVSRICSPPDLTENTINDVKENDIIFVKTDYLKSNYFQLEVLPRIKVPFRLVSGISSYTVDNYQPIIDNELCTKWFCTNPPMEHRKIVGIPIGFEEKERAGGDQELLKKYLNQENVEKKNKIILPYHTQSTNPVRSAAIEFLSSLPYVDVQQEKLGFDDYMKLLSEYKYCICLEGAGYDTHRNYECLLTGTVPIMKRSNIKSIYLDWKLPCMFVESWEDVAETNLDSVFDFSNVDKFMHVQSHIERIKNG